MKKINRVIFLVANIAMLLISCNPDQKTESHVADMNELDMDEWKCDKLSSETICLPKEWQPVDQDKIHYFAYIDNNDKQTYFTVAKYSVQEDKVNAGVYLKEVYRQLVNDSEAELFEGYTLKELKFPDKVAYYGEYYTEINNEKYFTYSMVLEYNGHLYDITLKVLRGKGPDYKGTFQKILTHLQVNKNSLFDKNEKIVEEKVVKLHE